MASLRLSAALVALPLWVGCTAPLDVPSAEVHGPRLRQELLGGLPSQEAAVFALVQQGQAFCSATLVGAQTLLTAAHCVDTADGREVTATNALRVAERDAGDTYRVVAARRHPDWTGNLLSPDLALLKLDRSPPVAPLLLDLGAQSQFLGRPVRLLGYGQDGRGDTGTRRALSTPATYTRIGDAGLLSTGTTDAGLCNGDSGGPLLVRGGDGVQRVAGVHSFSLGDCGLGASHPVSPHAAFFTSWLRQHEAPTCERDLQCAAGCPLRDLDCDCALDSLCGPACPDNIDPDCPFSCRQDGRCQGSGCGVEDPDCACAADGQCSARCTGVDPDCPRHCGPDGVCSVDVCPAPDSDCLAEGASCEPESPERCPGRVCASDRDGGATLCTRMCASTRDCLAPFSCDVRVGHCLPPLPPATQPAVAPTLPRADTGCQAAATTWLPLVWPMRRRGARRG